MGWSINCVNCNTETWANNIVDLIENHTDNLFSKDGGLIKCNNCGSKAYIYREYDLQESGQIWKSYTRGVFQIRTDFPTYFPYVNLTADGPDGKIDGIQLSYYKDTRSEEGGKLKHGHGPGGNPSLTQSEFITIIERMIQIGVFSMDDIKNLAKKLEQ